MSNNAELNDLRINRVQTVEEKVRFMIIIVQFHARLHRVLRTAHNFKLC